jgi:hypothetical protein
MLPIWDRKDRLEKARRGCGTRTVRLENKMLNFGVRGRKTPPRCSAFPQNKTMPESSMRLMLRLTSAGGRENLGSIPQLAAGFSEAVLTLSRQPTLSSTSSFAIDSYLGSLSFFPPESWKRQSWHLDSHNRGRSEVADFTMENALPGWLESMESERAIYLIR